MLLGGWNNDVETTIRIGGIFIVILKNLSCIAWEVVMWGNLFLVGLTLPFTSPSGRVCVEDDKESTRVCLPTISVKDMPPHDPVWIYAFKIHNYEYVNRFVI